MISTMTGSKIYSLPPDMCRTTPSCFRTTAHGSAACCFARRRQGYFRPSSLAPKVCFAGLRLQISMATAGLTW